MNDPMERATLFDQAAELYDQFRPSYPVELIDKMLQLSEVHASSKILEIGCGTGKATVLVAAHGHAIDGIDPGENLLTIAKVKCRDWPQVQFIKGKFEELELPRDYYDLIYAAQAFHWTNPQTRWLNCKKYLTSQGSVAIIHNYPKHQENEIAEELTRFIDQASGGLMQATPYEYDSGILKWMKEMEISGFFGQILVHRQIWNRRFTAEEYSGIFGTYSDFLSLSATTQMIIKEGISKIVIKNGGFYDYQYETVLIHGRV